MCWGRGEKEFVADGSCESDNLDAKGFAQVLLCDCTSSDTSFTVSEIVLAAPYSKQLTDGLAGAAPSSTRARLDPVLLEVGPICVTRPGIHVHGLVAVVLWALVFIHNPDANWRAQCYAKLGAGLDFDLVLLISRGCDGRLAGSSSCHLGLDVSFSKRHARRAAIDDGANTEAVGFAIAGEMSAIFRSSGCLNVRGHPEMLTES